MPKKILLADDSITIQKVIGLTFANEDIELTVVDNGDDCVDKAREIIPDLIIADVVMPGKDGYEVCYMTKRDPALMHIPILLLTGTFETFDEAMATKVGANGFITKPFESQSLIDKVNELIGAAQAVANAAGPGSLDADAEDLDPIEPVDTFDELEPVDSIDSFEESALDPADELAPVEGYDLSGGDEITEAAGDSFDPAEPIAEDFAEPEALEQSTESAGEGSIDEFTDPAETSFADVSLEDEQPRAMDVVDIGGADEIDDFETDVSPAPVPEAIAKARVEPPLQAQAAAPAAPAGDWNLNEFQNYMADAPTAPAAPQAASVAPESVQPPAEEGEEMDDLPAPIGEPEEIEDLPSSLDADIHAAAKTPPGHQGDVPTEPAFEPVTEDFAASDADADLPASLEPTDDMFASPTLDSQSDLPASLDLAQDEPTEVTMETEPIADTMETTFNDSPALDLAEEDEPMDVVHDDLGAETAPFAQAAAPLNDVANMYPLGEEENPPDYDTVPSFAAEQPAPAQPIVENVVSRPAVASAVTHADAAQIDNLLEAKLGAVAAQLEDRLRAFLADDALFQGLGSKASALVETKVDEVLARAVPEIVERVVTEAVNGTVERVLTDLLGRLRKS